MDSLSELGKIAGIAGITVGALVLIFQGIIQKSFLKQMSEDQSYKIIKTIIWIAGIMVLFGIASWVYMKTSGKADQETIVLQGTIVDETGGTVQDLHVKLTVGGKTSTASSDLDGIFVIQVSGEGEANGIVEIEGNGFQRIVKNVMIDFNQKRNDIGKMTIRRSTSQRDPTVNPATKAVDASGAHMSQQTNASTGNSYITISSSDYSYLLSSIGASANVNIILGGQTYNLNGSDLTIPYTQAGMIDYEITGYTNFLETTYCTNYSVGQIELASGAKYYLYENITNPGTDNCSWYLFNEYQFAQQKSALEQQMLQGFQ